MAAEAGTAVRLRGATVVDGTGAPGFRADVFIADGRIREVVGDAATAPHDAASARSVDADGLVLAPGFIDMHAHSDLALLTDPEHMAKVSQGVTLEVLGQDGLAYAPVDDRTLTDIRHQITGWNGDPEDFDWNWRDVGGYLDRLDASGIAVNACSLVPHGSVRMLVLGYDDRPPSPDELQRMRTLIREGMTQGAIGMSCGLGYTPGMYADTDELTELCRTVAELGGFLAPHHRSYGAGALDAYAEMIAVAQAAGCGLHLSHATMNFGVNEGRAGELIALLDAAIAEGCDLTLDTYPYLPGSTTLAALLPSWTSAQGPDGVLGLLADPAACSRIREDVEVRGSDGCHGVPMDWNTVRISGVGDPALAGRVGRTVAELARDDARAPFEVFRELLLADRLATTILHLVGHEENVRAIMRHPRHTAGSDGLLVGTRPHPRAGHVPALPRSLRRGARRPRARGVRRAPHRERGTPAALARSRPDPPRLRRRPGALRPRDRPGHGHLRAAAASGGRDRARVRQRRGSARTRTAHRRAARPRPASSRRRQRGRGENMSAARKIRTKVSSSMNDERAGA